MVELNSLTEKRGTVSSAAVSRFVRGVLFRLFDRFGRSEKCFFWSLCALCTSGGVDFWSRDPGVSQVGRDFCQWEDGWNFPNIVVAETKLTPRKPGLRGPQGGVNSGHCFPLRKGFCLSVNSQIISYWKNRLRHVVVKIAQVE